MSHYRRDCIPGATWFFTVVTFKRQCILCDAPVRNALREAIRQTRQEWPFQIDAWVLLPDHLHCLWTLPADDGDFSVRWNLIKRRTSKALRGNYFSPQLTNSSKILHRELTFWQRRFWEHRIQNGRDLELHAHYIHHNPVKHGLCRSPADWPYSSLRLLVQKGVYAKGWKDFSTPEHFAPGEPK